MTELYVDGWNDRQSDSDACVRDHEEGRERSGRSQRRERYSPIIFFSVSNFFLVGLGNFLSRIQVFGFSALAFNKLVSAVARKTRARGIGLVQILVKMHYCKSILLLS